MYAALSKHKICLSLTAIRKKIIPQVVAQVQTLCGYQQCASQQRNGHLGHDDKYLIWFIKEVEGFTRPHQTDLRTDIYVFIYTEATRSISSHIQSKDYKTFFFFNPNILKPLFSVKTPSRPLTERWWRKRRRSCAAAVWIFPLPLLQSHRSCSSGPWSLLKAAEGESPNPPLPALTGGSHVFAAD